MAQENERRKRQSRQSLPVTIETHRRRFPVQTICPVLKVAPSSH